jgi:hypothetical protein
VVANGNMAQFVNEKNGELSGLVTPGSEHDAAAAIQERFVQTVRLEHVLLQRNAPARITFLAVDVEGADEVVVSDSLLDTYLFDFVLIERPHIQTSTRMFKHGYLFSQHFWYDSLFVHSSHPEAGDVSNNKTYSQLPSRCRSPATGKWLGRVRLPGPCRSVFGCCEPI